MSKYVLDHHLEGEGARLALMSRLLDPMHRRHVEALGVGPGDRTLEVGCGNGSISAWLAERVGPGGRAVAVDLDLSLVDARAPGARAATGRHRRRPGRSRDLRPRDGAGGPAPRRRRGRGDPQSRRQPRAGRRDPADRAGLPARQRRRAARGPCVLGRLARLVARPGDRLPHRPDARPAPRGPGPRGRRGHGRDRRLQRRLAVGGLLDGHDHRAPRPARGLREARRPARSTRSSPTAPTRRWWTQTIAFTAVHARAGGG